MKRIVHLKWSKFGYEDNIAKFVGISIAVIDSRYREFGKVWL